MIEIAIGLIIPAILWLFKCSVDAGKDIAIIKEKLHTSEKATDEFKQVITELKNVVHELTLAVEVLKNDRNKKN